MKKVKRNSSIELYRILAMLFVLIVHCNGWLVGGIPDEFDEQNISLFRVSQATIQAITCTCVNMFLLISGYFGLKLKWESILNIYLLLISVTIPFYLISCSLGENFSISQLLRRFMAISRSGYFVECYLLLMFFSPVLNSFIEKMGKNIIAWVLAFWAIEVYFEFLLHDEDLSFKDGYSFIHFVLIYMLGRTLFLYKDCLLQISSYKYISLYFLFTLIILIIYLGLDMPFVYSYCSPFNILATCSLFLLFTKHIFYNRWINWIASSTFAVYVIHVNEPILNWLRIFDNRILSNFSYPQYLMIMGGGILLLFIGSVLYDKVAKLFTTPIIKAIEGYSPIIGRRVSVFIQKTISNENK